MTKRYSNELKSILLYAKKLGKKKKKKIFLRGAK